MWKWINCYLSGRHNFAIASEPGAIFLKCDHCGRRTPGWAVDPRWRQRRPAASAQPNSNAAPTAKAATLPIAS